MGMKSNSGLFIGTQGGMKFKLNIQHFSSKAFSSKGHVSISSLTKHGQDFLGKSPRQIEGMMEEAGYKCEVRPGRKSSTLVVSTNPSKDRNITQIQVSPNGSAHHGSDPYVKVSTKDIGVVKIVEGSKKTYNGRNEKATVIFKKGGKSK